MTSGTGERGERGEGGAPPTKSGARWRFDSGRVCLDLLATAPTPPAPTPPVLAPPAPVPTAAAPGAPPAPEPLAEPGALARWLLGAGLVPPGTRLPALGPDWTGAFVELRRSVDQLVTAALEGRCVESALETVNALAQGPPPRIRAVPDGHGALVRALSAAPTRETLLAAVARDAVELLTDPVGRARLRRCAGEGCARVYLDTSRGRRRRWCSSEVCGNRERVARHRRRATTPPAAAAPSRKRS
ncbi:ABATE domain-containing protein [Streptomyces sp. NPDC005805]|uniref:CGNR zinc finger domain-containing protein n=1 Tax=Streptomyces sp. NPDC005805 TaxID=3157068 RepID=UPI0034022AA8